MPQIKSPKLRHTSLIMDTKVAIFSVLVSVLAFDITSCNSASCFDATCDGCQILADITEQISSLQSQINSASQPGVSPAHPADSCAAVLQANFSSPSGYYWIVSSEGSPVSVYCDMTRSCGNITGGWMRVAELDMTDSTQCPSGLKLFTDFDRLTCGIESTGPSCSSATFYNAQKGYSKICGKIRGYQYYSTDAFANSGRGANPSIDTYYVDGVSLTHGSNPRQHIWTFASALDEYPSTNPFYKCPCTDINNSDRTSPPPDYVGNDYFCDTGSAESFRNILYIEDPLWDGAGCGTSNECCSLNNPPWFFKKLSQPTSDDIEMRVCRDEAVSNEDIRIEAVDIYVQ